MEMSGSAGGRNRNGQAKSAPTPSIPLPPRLPIKLFYAPPPMILLLPIHPYHQMDQNLVAPMRIILILLFTKKFIF